MKRFLLSILVGLTVLSAMGQEHLTFKGIPIDGRSSKMVRQLKWMGYRYIGKNGSGIPVLKGPFAGRDNCLIQILEESKNVYEIVVSSTEYPNWYSAKTQYNSLKNSLEKKYILYRTLEEFNSPYSEGDGYEGQALTSGHCHWGCFFYCGAGQVTMHLAYDQSIGFFINLVYVDDINSRHANSVKESDL